MYVLLKVHVSVENEQKAINLVQLNLYGKTNKELYVEGNEDLWSKKMYATTAISEIIIQNQLYNSLIMAILSFFIYAAPRSAVGALINSIMKSWRLWVAFRDTHS